MAIVVSYDHYDDLQCEVVVFLDDETGDCFQIQCDLPATPGSYQISAGVGAPVEQGVIAWQRVDDEFGFALSAKAAAMFGGNARLHFEVEPSGGDTIDSIAAHLERMMRLQQHERRE
ncbi:hypothetical protein DFR67_108230 [Williamsia limnetica]|uniref:Immunity protein 10 of polymorphic toxin system n=1 Tax=Williamsia limnetica TaxID=882452 RepID=A0A318RL97_WILLI|nr:hypothetical protein [Williamsia limnetica]PYE16479.1 hypothetical protein DFR67_108230 [Williamsia limnetica]